MRDLVAVLAIAGTVVALGVFRVPDGDALVAAGIRAEADRALYQARHPLEVAVQGRSVTVSGRVESQAERLDVLTRLRALDGVEEVRDRLTLLPTVAPFRLDLRRGPEGMTALGHVPSEALGADLAARTGAEPLPVAAGVPDRDWAAIAERGAQALGLLQSGRFVLEDRAARLDGVANLPSEVAQAQALLADLPEGYGATLELSALDDGLPYALSVVRDARMGLRIAGKLPPGFDLSAFASLGTAQEMRASPGPVALDSPGFEAAVLSALPVFALLGEGTLTVAPGVVSLSGGPLPPEGIAQASALVLPEGWRLELALVPQDDDAPLALRVTWDGARMVAEGKVPSDTGLDGIDDSTGILRGPYPDLEGWAADLAPALEGLRLMDSGELLLEGGTLQVTGVVANPGVKAQALAVLPDGARHDLILRDDGTPPAFTVLAQAGDGATVSGKLPSGLSVDDLGAALGLPVTGAPTRAPGGSGAGVEAVLRALAPWLPLAERVELTYTDGAAPALSLTVQAGADADRIAALLRPDLPRGVDQTVQEAAPPVTGTQRLNVLTGRSETARFGVWLPELTVTPDRTGCAEAAEGAPAVHYEPGVLRPGPQSLPAVNHMTALARICTRMAGLRLVVQAEAVGTGIEILDRQMARRRAEALRALLLERGVPAGAVTATGAAGRANAARLTLD